MPKEFILLSPFALTLAYAFYLKFWVVRRYRTALRQARKESALAVAGPESKELEELRKRVQVLERIATDSNSRLEREFDELLATK